MCSFRTSNRSILMWYSSLCTERYWKLLSEVLSSSSAAWLRPILARMSIVPIVTAFMNSWSQLETLHHAAYCILILYPLGTQKSTTEVLLDAWGAFLNNFIDDVSAVKVGLVLTKVYSDTLSNSPSRKKVCSLPFPWLCSNHISGQHQLCSKYQLLQRLA